MKIAVISDVHSNLPALEAVKEDIESKSVDKVVCLGDIIGYNAWPSECVEIVRDWCDVVLQGNHDREVSNPDKYAANQMAHEGLLWSAEQLSDEQFEWLQNLPADMVVEFDGVEYLIAHSHPTQLDRYVQPRDFPRLRPELDDELGCWIGHTHLQHKAEIDGRLILNPGSVGQPRDKDARAAYAIVDTESNTAEYHRVSYDISRTMTRVDEVGLPKGTASRLQDGR